jgi:hypothetical protein
MTLLNTTRTFAATTVLLAASACAWAAKPAPAKPAAAPAPLSQAQLDAAGRVMVGTAQCAENHQVQVAAAAGQPGYFKLTTGKTSYTLAPEPTSSGAVRLEDKKSGMVWIQIPAKSMLMDAKRGQRVLDACQMPGQS